MRPEKARNTKPIDKRKLLYEKSGGIWPECGRKMELNNPRAYKAYMTIDHIVPLSRGGTSNIDNLRGLCRACNGRKSNSLRGVNTKISENGHYVSKMTKRR
ncbi:MAG: HNH endonuclease [Lachnospiraceae bacterium]|nr:HNH endonuclease [Lachnospiraceae bacterium]